jgi:iron complex transport system substrate-binding protein
MSRLRTPFRALALLAVASIALTGCASASATGPVDTSCKNSSTPLTELDLLENPVSYEGGSTACLVDTGIPAIAEDVTSSLPVTVTDVEGNDVTITDASRILPLDISGSIAATVFGLGLGDNVVGRDTSTDFAGTEDLPVATNAGHTLNAEAIVGLSPTVILTDTSIGPKDARAQLRDAGIPIVVLSDERSLDTVDDLIASVAEALGIADAGAKLSERVQGEISQTMADIATVAPASDDKKLRMLFLYARGSAGVYYIFGSDTGADSLIESVGGVDVADDIGWVGSKPMTAEALVQAAPDVILMMTDGLASVGGIDGLLTSIPAVAATPAGEKRRIVDMADTEILSFGPRTPQILDALARAIYAPEFSGPAE